MSSEEQERFVRFCCTVWEHIRHARTKHPILQTRLGTGSREKYDERAELHRREARQCGEYIDEVLYSETNEFLAEVASDKLSRMLEEGADVCAVIWRGLEARRKGTQS